MCLAPPSPISTSTGAVPPVDVSDDDPLLLSYTSGTTGKPKGAVLTHANCFWTNLSFDRTSGIADGDVVLQVLPQFHSGGWNVQALLAWWKGATVVLEPSFDAARALDLIEEKRVTTMMGVPATYLFMSEQPGFANVDLSSLRLAVVGGAPMPESLLHTWRDRGVDIVQGYGLTEAAPNVLCLPPEDAARKLGFAGKPYPHVDVALRDPETGEHLDGEATGELVVRGPNVFAGYWQDPEATEAAFADGWLLTGDLAQRDDEGYYRIVGRLKELVISGGENIYPAEIEDVLHAHEAVAEAAVIGVPDERWGEVCVAFVALRQPGAADAEELLEWCRGRLARYKVPREIRLRGRTSALGHEQGAEAGAALRARAGGGAMTEAPAHRSRGPAALVARSAHAAASARGRGGGLRGARLSRRVDREAHGGRRCRSGHVLPLLLEQEGDLRRARPRPEPSSPAGDDGGRVAG